MRPCIVQLQYNTFMNNGGDWSNKLKSCGVRTAIVLKCLCTFFNIMHGKINHLLDDRFYAKLLFLFANFSFLFQKETLWNSSFALFLRVPYKGRNYTIFLLFFIFSLSCSSYIRKSGKAKFEPNRFPTLWSEPNLLDYNYRKAHAHFKICTL